MCIRDSFDVVSEVVLDQFDLLDGGHIAVAGVGLEERDTAVSYTHLDVYKRQKQENPARPEIFQELFQLFFRLRKVCEDLEQADHIVSAAHEAFGA